MMRATHAGNLKSQLKKHQEDFVQVNWVIVIIYGFLGEVGGLNVPQGYNFSVNF